MTEPTETEETRLRQAFALIGDEAGRPGPAASVRTVPAAARPPHGRRRVRAALAVAAAVCTATILVTVAVTADGGSGTDPDATGRGQTFPQALDGTLAECDRVGDGPTSPTSTADTE